jgi:hypothetical protein
MSFYETKNPPQLLEGDFFLPLSFGEGLGGEVIK